MNTTTDYQFFEDSCKVQRTYRVMSGWHCERAMFESNAFEARRAKAQSSGEDISDIPFFHATEMEEMCEHDGWPIAPGIGDSKPPAVRIADAQ